MSSAAAPAFTRSFTSAPRSPVLWLTGMGEIVETTDPESAEHILRSAYGSSMRVNPRGQQRGIRRARTPLGPLVWFEHSRIAMSLDLAATPMVS